MKTKRRTQEMEGWRWSGLVRTSVLGVTLSAVAGCHAVVKENYFLATPQQDGIEHRNYYRVTVRGRALASQARYVSGFFDEAAVEEYFGEFSQPEGGKLPPPKAGETEGTNDELLDERLKHRSLVLMLSANSDAVAGQLGALAENEHVMGVLGTMLGRGNQEAITTREYELSELEARADAFRSRAYALLATPADIREADVLALGNQLAAILGASERFEDADALRAWLDARRDVLRGEGK